MKIRFVTLYHAPSKEELSLIGVFTVKQARRMRDKIRIRYNYTELEANNNIIFQPVVLNREVMESD